MVADQGSTAVAAQFFLANHFGLCAELLSDPPHRFWDIEKLGMLQGEAWEAIVLAQVICNTNDSTLQHQGVAEPALGGPDRVPADGRQ